MDVRAVARRSGGWWAIEVPEVPGVYSQSRRLDQVEAMAADAVGVMLDVDPSTVHASLELALASGRLESDLFHLQELNDHLEETQREASKLARSVIHELREDAHLSVRDIGVMLHISPQRVSQLMKSMGLAAR